jgi:hypothetical protein
MLTTDERTAIHKEIEDRLDELEDARDRLLVDQDDPMVLSELTVVESQIRSCRQALACN